MIQTHGGKCIGRVAGIAVVIARDVSRILTGGFHTVVTTEARTSYLQVIHANDGQKVVLGVTGLAIVLREDVSHGAWS